MLAAQMGAVHNATMTSPDASPMSSDLAARQRPNRLKQARQDVRSSGRGAQAISKQRRAEGDRAARPRRRRRTSHCRQRQPTAPGGGAIEKSRNNLMLLDMQQASRCQARSKRSGLQCRAPAVRGSNVCRMHGASGGAPRGNMERSEAWGLHGRDARLEREIQALAQMARETMAAIE